MLEIELSEIKAIEAEVQGKPGYVSLSQGALRVGGIHPDLKHYMQEMLNTDKTDYYQSPWGLLSLREKIAEYLSKKNNTTLTAKNVLVSHGCVGALSTLMLLLLEPGDEVILPEPCYPSYPHLIGLARAKHVYVSCFENTQNLQECPVWTLNLDAIKAAKTKKTKMLVFANPCNPTGDIIPKQTLLQLAAWCEQEGIYLVVDESYDAYIFEGQCYSSSELVAQSKFVIRVGSYSKTLSMSGWRMGFMVIPDHLCHLAGTVQDAVICCPNVPAQYAVMYALEHPEYLQKFHNTVQDCRDVAMMMLQPLVDQGIFTIRKPAASLYLFLKTPLDDAIEMNMSILNHAKVGLIPGRAFGPSGKPYMRLCYARKREVLQEGIDRIINYLGASK